MVLRIIVRFCKLGHGKAMLVIVDRTRRRQNHNYVEKYLSGWFSDTLLLYFLIIAHLTFFHAARQDKTQALADVSRHVLFLLMSKRYKTTRASTRRASPVQSANNISQHELASQTDNQPPNRRTCA